MYLNVYVPGLQYEHGINRFFRYHRGQPLPSAALMSPMTRSFVAALEDFVARHEIPLVQFEKGQRKDTVMAEHLRPDAPVFIDGLGEYQNGELLPLAFSLDVGE